MNMIAESDKTVFCKNTRHLNPTSVRFPTSSIILNGHNTKFQLNMTTVNAVKQILIDTLHLQGSSRELNADSILLGGLPELDSMAVLNVIAALEEHFGIGIDDEDISAKTFETLGSLAHFVDQKR